MLVTLFLSFFAIILGIILITYILSVVGLWKMFQKAGKPGWPSLIPIYNTYILCEITGVSPWWLVISFGAGFITAFIPFLGFLVLLLVFTLGFYWQLVPLVALVKKMLMLLVFICCLLFFI